MLAHDRRAEHGYEKHPKIAVLEDAHRHEVAVGGGWHKRDTWECDAIDIAIAESNSRPIE